MTPAEIILWVPAVAALLLALITNYRLGAALNIVASGA
jgi:hypothetical protein